MERRNALREIEKGLNGLSGKNLVESTGTGEEKPGH